MNTTCINLSIDRKQSKIKMKDCSYMGFTIFFSLYNMLETWNAILMNTFIIEFDGYFYVLHSSIIFIQLLACTLKCPTSF